MNTYTTGQQVSYTNGSPFIQTGIIVKVSSKKQLVVIKDAAGMELWNAGYAVGDCIAPSQVLPTYEVIRESATSNRIVKELNAAVCTATFPVSGVQLADLYTSNNSCNVLVFHNSCAPIHSTFVKTVSINLIK